LIRKDPENPSPIFNLGLAYAQMGNVPLGIQYTQKALQIDPDSLMIKLQLSRLYLYNQQPGKARNLLRSLKESFPKVAEIYYQLGEAAVIDDQYETALEYFHQAKQKMPDMPGLDQRIQEIKNTL
jgi:tetratricopeptide (TPR) repeat protein